MEVLSILDPFTESCLEPEVELIPVSKAEWQQEIDSSNPKLLFVESAWRGNGGEWNYALTKPEKHGQELKELIAHCSSKGIPTLFWNKEDPANFDTFIDAAALFDFGVYFHANASELVRRGSGPYFYLPKLESHLEARLWNDVFLIAQDTLGIPRGTIRATVLIETILAAFEMDEILYELREHSAGLNAGRWDYIFSVIKKFRNHQDLILPDRGQITMTVPFMRAYTELLVKTCHRRGIHAMGGMAAFIPNRRDPEVTERALRSVRDDKLREAGDGFDGTWVAHPDLVPTAMEVFDEVLGDRPNQIDRLRDEVEVDAAQLLNTQIEGGVISEAGIRTNVRVGVEYMASWMRGNGAAALYNLMEDAATAEISRSQIWQWVHNRAQLDDGRTLTADLVDQITDEEMEDIRTMVGDEFYATGLYEESRRLFETVAIAPEFQEFLTIPAYELID